MHAIGRFRDFGRAVAWSVAAIPGLSLGVVLGLCLGVLLGLLLDVLLGSLLGVLLGLSWVLRFL